MKIISGILQYSGNIRNRTEKTRAISSSNACCAQDRKTAGIRSLKHSSCVSVSWLPPPVTDTANATQPAYHPYDWHVRQRSGCSNFFSLLCARSYSVCHLVCNAQSPTGLTSRKWQTTLMSSTNQSTNDDEKTVNLTNDNRNNNKQ